ncbi:MULTISPECIES: hypothetical protein [Pseudanabaena]|jgi:hypothetical protein|uniref:hypothetical protein n=1 Tax=Pseudanabaena TaxID=1152 RepID=UPI00247A8150|nr:MULTISPECIES: hypothetical protein [Pseudanabaena]MEA5489477.1 hypothetical protein [Pseudanabaena sp. CCNP1317]WGS74945.1 hypothetical protein OA858_24475 [Pseudanabaena galeata CCNP1313]
MSESIKATRATVAIGGLTVDGFMLPDGTYRMSQTQAAETVGKDEINARRFLSSKNINAIRGEGYTPDSIEVESLSDKRGQTRFNALPLDVVTAYWLYQSSQGNQKALALVWALLSESLERRFDDAFGVVRTEQERNEATTSRIKALESDLANLGEGFALDDESRRERNYFESLLKQNGIEPYSLPSSDRTEGDK